MSSGLGQFGVVGSVSLGAQRTVGVDLVTVFAVIWHETGRLVVDASRDDLPRSEDLAGLTYAGFGSALGVDPNQHHHQGGRRRG